MKKWLMMVLPATLSLSLAIPSFGATTSDALYNVSIYSDAYNLTVGNTANLHLYLPGAASDATSSLEIQTTIGSLNGQGSKITLSPSDLKNPVSLTSTLPGQAVVSVLENGVVVNKTTVVFSPGPISSVNVKATPDTSTVGIPVTLTITAVDQYGNKVADGTAGGMFTLQSTDGYFSTNGYDSSPNSISVSLQGGSAKVLFNDNSVGKDNITVTDFGVGNNQVKINGQVGNSVSIPVSFGYVQGVTVSSPTVYTDTADQPQEEISSLQELSQLGVLHGYTDQTYHPNDPMKRSEFATVVARYMGLGSLTNVFGGSKTPFADVSTDAWYDGAVYVCSQFGYVHGDGTNFYPDQNVTNAEVAQIILNNLEIATPPNSFPNGAMAVAKQNHLFDNVSGVLDPNVPATRGNIAIIVCNALHTTPSVTQSEGTTGGILPLNPTKSLEAQTLGYTWHGDSSNLVSVSAVPGSGLDLGNEIGTSDGILHLANNVVISGASSLDDLLNKKIQYLTNPTGFVTFIEVDGQ